MTCGCAYERIPGTNSVRQYSESECKWCSKCHRIFCLEHAKIHAKYKGTRLHSMRVKP